VCRVLEKWTLMLPLMFPLMLPRKLPLKLPLQYEPHERKLASCADDEQ